METFYLVSLIILGITAALFSKEFYQKSEKGKIKIKWKDFSVMCIAILTIAVTQFKTCSEKKLAGVKDKANADTLLNREQRYVTDIKAMTQSFADSLKKNQMNTTELLARYGLKVDSTNNVIVKLLSDSALDKQRPVVNFMTGTFPSIDFFSDSIAIPLQYYSETVEAYNLVFKNAMFIIENNKQTSVDTPKYRYPMHAAFVGVGLNNLHAATLPSLSVRPPLKSNSIIYIVIKGSYQNSTRSKTYPLFKVLSVNSKKIMYNVDYLSDPIIMKILKRWQLL